MAVNKDTLNFRDKLSFFAEWYDYDSTYRKKFILNFYLWDNTIELYDRELNRMFLRRTKMETIGLDDMFLGNTVRIHGRQVKITNCADCCTQNFIDKIKQNTLVLLEPSVVKSLGEIITRFQKENFVISKMRMCLLTRKEALQFYERRRGENDLPFTIEQMVSGPIIAMELVGENAIEKINKVLGPQDPIEARKTNPSSLRALYGLDSTATSGFHATSDPKYVTHEINFFFPQDQTSAPQSTVQLKNTTCCIVKPHAISEGKLGYIITAIHECNFKITAAQMHYLTTSNADEFLEVYKGVVSDYNALLRSFLDGPCVALEVASENEEMNVHGEFRKLCGPQDSEIARQIRPNSLRARFGCNKYKNAVHCTDLPEDTELELEYFFKVVG